MIDCVSVSNPRIKVLIPKLKVDGITKVIEEQEFLFDNTFSDEDSTETIYET